MAKTAKREFGDRGESIAEDYLTGNGYRILGKNYEIAKIGEIDIISEKNGVLIFCEVKTRDITHETNFPIAFSIGPHKRRRLRRICEIYIQENEKVAKNKEWRIDAILILVDRATGGNNIEHVENILWERYY